MVLRLQTAQHKSYLPVYVLLQFHREVSLIVFFKIFEKYLGKEFHFIKVTYLQSETLLEIKLLPIAFSASTSIYFVEHLSVAAFVYDTKRKT